MNSNSTKYATKYHISNTSNGIEIYEICKTGDATKEVYLGEGTGSWFGDYAYFAYSSMPFFIRGGRNDNGYAAGIFYSRYYTGENDGTTSFRTVLCP